MVDKEPVRYNGSLEIPICYSRKAIRMEAAMKSSGVDHLHRFSLTERFIDATSHQQTLLLTLIDQKLVSVFQWYRFAKRSSTYL